MGVPRWPFAIVGARGCFVASLPSSHGLSEDFFVNALLRDPEHPYAKTFLSFVGHRFPLRGSPRTTVGGQAVDWLRGEGSLNDSRDPNDMPSTIEANEEVLGCPLIGLLSQELPLVGVANQLLGLVLGQLIIVQIVSHRVGT